MLIIQRSQIAAFSCFGPLAGCPQRPYIPSCAERGAGVGRSSTGRSYETARKGRSGKSTGVVDETATGSANFFGPAALRHADLALDYDRRDAPASSAEHRPGRHRRSLGGRARGVRLLRPRRRRSKRRDGDRARSRLLRRYLVLRPPPRRRGARPAPPAPVERPGYAARRPGQLGVSANSSFRVSSGPSSSSSRSRAGAASGSRLSRCATRRRTPRCVGV
jgi:hypothetical protein